MFRRINITPRWIIFIIDIMISMISLGLSYMMREDFSSASIIHPEFLTNCLILIALSVPVFYSLRIYAGIIRLTTVQDTFRILLSVLLINFSFFIIHLFSVTYRHQPLIPLTVLIINSFVGFVLLTVYRIIVKHSFSYFKNLHIDRKRVILYGASEAGLLTKRTIEQDDKVHYEVVVFIDDDHYKVKKALDGIRVLHSSSISEIIKNEKIDELIITVAHMAADKKNKIVDICLDLGIRVLHIPPVDAWINGQLSARQIQKIRIEELLEREPIQIHNDVIHSQLKKKRILVTGAAGSIGGEIVRQLAKYHPAVIILVDTAESALYEAELAHKEEFENDIFKYFIADVRNRERMESIFNEYRPQYVYHAAAYKHVPMMELHPSEAVSTNILGTKNLADLSLQYGVTKFVMVSTDKAVNPTNVMGATKRIAEIYVQSLYNHCIQKGQQIENGFDKYAIRHADNIITKFITTRFGNVLGSNGSVIPRFTAQINNGGPVTITHPDICRYFMTIPEACQLVLEAGTMGQGGEIFVFDMGKMVKIVDLAKKMIRLSGLTPGVDIDIKFTGLRPGEKLHEELLNNEENTIPTYHGQIMIANVRKYNYEDVVRQIDELIGMTTVVKDDMEIVQFMKRMVPEYVSNNSVFEQLDKNVLKIIA